MLIESHRIEYKQSLTDSFEKEVVAFLNYHEGGIIYIGVNKDGKIVGCQNPDETQLKIKDKLKHNISPSCLGLFEVILETIEEKPVIKIIVASGRETPYYIKKNGMSEKGCFIRVGSSSEPMNQIMIENLFAKRVRNSLSNIKSRRQDLTFEQLKIYYEEKGLKLNEKFLKKQGFKIVFNYLAPIYNKQNITDKKLIKKLNKVKPNYILTNIGGGTQEILGYYLKKKLKFKTSIYCTGGAISYFTGTQAPINKFFDKFYLGWLIRILYNPRSFLYRYLISFKLIIILLRSKITINQ